MSSLVCCTRITERISMMKMGGKTRKTSSVFSSSVKSPVFPPSVRHSIKKTHTQLCLHSFLLCVRLWEWHSAAEEGGSDKERRRSEWAAATFSRTFHHFPVCCNSGFEKTLLSRRKFCFFQRQAAIIGCHSSNPCSASHEKISRV